MVENVYRRTAPLNPAALSTAQTPPGPVAKPIEADEQAGPQPDRVQAANQVQIGVSTADTPLTKPDLSFPQPSAPAADPGMQELQGLFSGIDGDMGKFFQSVAEGHTPSDINLQTGQNFAVATILTTRDSTDVGEMTQALNFLSRATAKPPEAGYSLDALKPQDHQSLRRLGLMVYQGRVINMVNKQEVSAAQLKALSQLASHQTIACGRPIVGETPGETKMRQFSTGLASAALKINALKAMQQTVMSSNDSMRQLQEDLGHINDDIRLHRDKAAQIVGQIQNDVAALKGIQTSSQGLKANPIAWLSQPGQLQTTQQILQNEGIIASFSPGKPVIFRTKDGKTIGLPEVLTRLNAAEQRQESAIAARTQNLANENRTLAILDGNSERLADKLGEATKLTGLALETEAEVSRDVDEHVLPEIDQRSKDPGLSDDERQAYRELGRQARACRAQSESIRAAAQQGINRSHRLLDANSELRTSLRQLLNQLPQMFSNRLHEEIAKLLERVELPKDAQAELDRLLDKAAEIEANLSLAPRPAEIDVQKMSEVWASLLENITVPFAKLEQSEKQTSRLEANWSRAMLAQVQDQLSYHLKQLKSLDAHDQKRQEAALRNSIQSFLTK